MYYFLKLYFWFQGDKHGRLEKQDFWYIMFAVIMLPPSKKTLCKTFPYFLSMCLVFVSAFYGGNCHFQLHFMIPDKLLKSDPLLLCHAYEAYLFGISYTPEYIYFFLSSFILKR